jgi:RNA polymerase-interacting CarD/CdnL/TRCF family regulator
MLTQGDLIFHPKYGFGSINGLTKRDRLQPMNVLPAGEGAGDTIQDYYDIELLEGGNLLVPVSRAEGAGLRRLSNGVDAIKRCLHSPAQSLPTDPRKRAAELAMRGQLAQPNALAASVRDMLAHTHGRSLTMSEQAWLRKACERLSMEAALVDGIPRSRALAAILELVNQVNAAQ